MDNTQTLVGAVITIPAWRVTGQVIRQRPVLIGGDYAVSVLVETSPNDLRPRWYRLESDEYEVRS